MAAGEIWGTSLCRQAVVFFFFRKPLSVSIIIILIIQTHSVIDLLSIGLLFEQIIQLIPFQEVLSHRGNPQTIRQLQSCRQMVDSAHTHTYTRMHIGGCEHLFDSPCYPGNHMKNCHWGLSFTKLCERWWLKGCGGKELKHNTEHVYELIFQQHRIYLSLEMLKRIAWTILFHWQAARKYSILQAKLGKWSSRLSKCDILCENLHPAIYSHIPQCFYDQWKHAKDVAPCKVFSHNSVNWLWHAFSSKRCKNSKKRD